MPQDYDITPVGEALRALILKHDAKIRAIADEMGMTQDKANAWIRKQGLGTFIREVRKQRRQKTAERQREKQQRRRTGRPPGNPRLAEMNRQRKDKGRTARTKEEVIQALEKHNGLIFRSARHLKINATTMRKYVDRWGLQVLIDELRGRHVDNAEYSLAVAVKRGDEWAVKYTLSTLGQERGYVPVTKRLVGQDPDSPPLHPRGVGIGELEKILDRLPLEVVRAIRDTMVMVREEQLQGPKPVEALPGPVVPAELRGEGEDGVEVS